MPARTWRLCYKSSPCTLMKRWNYKSLHTWEITKGLGVLETSLRIGDISLVGGKLLICCKGDSVLVGK